MLLFRFGCLVSCFQNRIQGIQLRGLLELRIINNSSGRNSKVNINNERRGLFLSGTSQNFFLFPVSWEPLRLGLRIALYPKYFMKFGIDE